RRQFVPLTMLPELGPLVGLDGQGELALLLVLDNDAGLVAEVEIARGEAADALAVDAHQIAALVIVDHGLIRLALHVTSQEQPRIRTEVIAHLQAHLEVAILLLSDDDAAVALYVLSAEDGLLFLIDVPLAA